MKLALYSYGGDPKDHEMHCYVSELVGKGGTITYIPSVAGPNSHMYFETMKSWYTPFGINSFSYFAADTEYSESDLIAAFSTEGIFLSGGNTFMFLNTLAKKNLLSRLRDYVNHGGVLIGQSAGAIIMTRRINISNAPGLGSDDNSIELTNMNSLGLVPFEFSPHFSGEEDGLIAIRAYSSIANIVVYGCPDGSGIIINGRALTLFGGVHCVNQGTSYVANV